MAANITDETLDQLVEATKTVHNRINSAIGSGGFMADADDYTAELGHTTPSLTGKADALDALAAHRRALALIAQDGRQMVAPILLQMGIEAGSRTVQGERITNYARLFRDISADLLGGTPDYVTKREVTFAADPAPAAAGVYSRLTVDHLGEKIEDGFHNQTKIIRVVSKDDGGRVRVQIEGQPRSYEDALDYRAGRLSVVQMTLMGDATGVQAAARNPWFEPQVIVDGADIGVGDMPQWGVVLTGSPEVQVRTGTTWRTRPSSIRVKGANTTAVEFRQPMRPLLLRDPYNPWQVGVPVYREDGWEGTVDLVLGDKSQQFAHGAMTADAWTILKFTLDEDNYPVNFDEAAPLLSVKATNGAANTDHLFIAGVMPQQMVRHEGIWYSGYSHVTDPTIESLVEIDDQSTFVGKVQDVLSFLFHGNAPGWAHLPSSGSATIDT